MARSAYVALYKAVMNINEDGHRPHGWHGLEGDRWIKRETPTDTSKLTIGGVQKLVLELTTRPRTEQFKSHFKCHT